MINLLVKYRVIHAFNCDFRDHDCTEFYNFDFIYWTDVGCERDYKLFGLGLYFIDCGKYFERLIE